MTGVADSQPWSDSLWRSDSGVIVLFSSGTGSLIMAGGQSLSVGDSSKVSAVEGVDGMGSGFGCVQDWG